MMSCPTVTVPLSSSAAPVVSLNMATLSALPTMVVPAVWRNVPPSSRLRWLKRVPLLTALAIGLLITACAGPQIERQHRMPDDAQRLTDPAGRFQLESMPLAIVERECVAFETRMAGDRQHGGRIQPATDQNDGSRKFRHVVRSFVIPCQAASAPVLPRERPLG